jgi:hypothetical protein
MIIMMSEQRLKQIAKRLRKVLRDLGVELKHFACLELAARLCGFDDWRHYLDRDLSEALSRLDEDLSDADFTARGVPDGRAAGGRPEPGRARAPGSRQSQWLLGQECAGEGAGLGSDRRQ